MSADIRALRHALHIADKENQAMFHELVVRSIEILKIEDQTISRRFGMSLSALGLWKNGKAAPHPSMRVPVYEWLIRLCDTKLPPNP